MRAYAMRWLLTAAIVFAGIYAAPRSVWAQPPFSPSIDREAAEKAFLEAYDYFIKNRLWNSREKLKEALKKNTYFIDIYYLESLLLHRMGAYPEAIRAMKSYLEVRRNDYRGNLILASMEEEWAIVRKNLYPTELDAGYRFNAAMTRDFLPEVRYLPSYMLGGIKGLGKLSASPSFLFLPDIFGDRLWVFSLGEKKWMGWTDVSSPVAVVALTKDEALLFQRSGDVKKIRVDEALNVIQVQPQGTVAANIADAVAVSSALIAVADRTGEAVRFYSYPDLKEAGSWSARNRGKRLFEPVGLTSFGPLLAVLDRGNGVVSIIDTYTLKEKHSFKVPTPRDLVWGDQGELYILSEEGALYVVFPADGKKEPQLVAEGLKEAWSLAWVRNAPVVTDITGRVWWSGYPILPGNKPHIGAVNLEPVGVQGVKGQETLHLMGAIGTAFDGFVKQEIPMIQVVWRNEVRPCTVITEIEEDKQTPWFYTVAAEKVNGAAVTVVSDVKQLMTDIGKRSLRGEKLPRVVVMDSRITAQEHQLVSLLAFFLQQGIRADILSLERPASVMMTRLSRMTRGYTCYAWPVTGLPGNNRLKWNVALPLPPEPVTYGYPSEATLSFFADVHSIQFRDWIPVWPSLLKRIK